MAVLVAGPADTSQDDLLAEPVLVSNEYGNTATNAEGGACRAIYPLEKAMVDGMKNRPFAVVGVNGDDDKEEVKRVIDKEKLNWSSWWDGGPNRNRIGERWQVNAYPTIYVLDHKGVIRYRFIGVPGPALEHAVDQLLQECEKEKKPGKK